ncbi:hypothetical protein F5148DRAFT_852123 [Russula earlei]|uniref:Uncharacterized protein n=1 Tax=Russula earlei TaxID=71964 RepID=A0ACC0ULS3_9AGAM|nr:hypothetical protein F5148DRAFT_852123 [Russula earlei]
MSTFRRCWSSRPSTASGSEGWSIQSWRSAEAVAIGCIPLTCSGVVEGCQLPHARQAPGKRCLADWCFSQSMKRKKKAHARPPPFSPSRPLLARRIPNGDPRLFFCSGRGVEVRVRVRVRVRASRGRRHHDVGLGTGTCDAPSHAPSHAHALALALALAPVLRVCPRFRWEAAGREERQRPAAAAAAAADARRRSRRVRPFTPFSLDAGFLLLLWDVHLRPRLGEFFGCI